MGESVVVGLESVDIEHDERERRQFTDGTAPFLIQKVVELPAIGNAGETVKRGQAQQHLVRFLELTHHLKQFLLPSPPAIDFADNPPHPPHPSPNLAPLA